MKKVTFLHTSDWQLGMTRWFLDGEAQARFEQDRLAAISRLGEIAVEYNCEFIVVAGDVFEHNSLSPRTFGRAQEVLKKLPVDVYLLPGNHDPLTADSMLRNAAELPNVHLIETHDPFVVLPGVELVGAPLTSKHSVVDLVAASLAGLEPQAEGHVRIGVGHGQAESRGGDANIDLAVVELALSERKIDYLALGDTHSSEQVGDSGKVWFSGSPETTDFYDRASLGGGESNSGNALVVTVDEATVDVREVPVGAWTFEALIFDVNSRSDIDSFLAALDAYPDKSRTVVKYALRGTLGIEDLRYLERNLEQREPVFAALFERKRLMSLMVEPTSDELLNLEVTGYARNAMHELLEHKEDERAADALRLLFRFAQEAAS
ncbi:metallophosphoesterase family protein [Corynebacterium freiburgense]|uniref:metallophosphoesterase family protein n=1 Tax=Corynebacterium freiburgense TaxID=556548 RepID=UPI00040984DA|nr:DNA repair exonuclease [Corynebacterium freiburgense]WJZ02334.1 putative metallophosphoesterase YhaO [Corynebacterium freiburgense]